MLPLIVLKSLSTRLYYLQHNIYLTFPLRICTCKYSLSDCVASQSYIVCASQDLAAGKQCASMGGRKFPGRVFEAPQGRDLLQRLLHELPLVDLTDIENI